MEISPQSLRVNARFVTCTQKRKRVSGRSETLDFQLQSNAPRMLAALRSSQMSQESKRTYTIRLPETVAARVEKQAAISGTAPTTLIQSLVVDACTHIAETAVGGSASNLIGRLDALSKVCERLEQNAAERYTRLLFELVKTRSAFLHALDQS